MIDITHIHPMLVHFPLALVPVALGIQLYALLKGQGLFGRGCAQVTGLGLLALAAVIAVVAAMFGDVALDAAVDAGVPDDLLEDHEDLGQISAILLVLISIAGGWLFRRQPSPGKADWAFWLAGAGVLVVLLVTAWHGGHLVYDHGVNVHIRGH